MKVRKKDGERKRVGRRRGKEEGRCEWPLKRIRRDGNDTKKREETSNEELTIIIH